MFYQQAAEFDFDPPKGSEAAESGVECVLCRVEYYTRKPTLGRGFDRPTLAVATIPAAYKECWQIELSFGLKQNLDIETFVGTSEDPLQGRSRQH